MATEVTGSEILDKVIEKMVEYNENGEPYIWLNDLYHYNGLTVENMLPKKRHRYKNVFFVNFRKSRSI